MLCLAKNKKNKHANSCLGLHISYYTTKSPQLLIFVLDLPIITPLFMPKMAKSPESNLIHALLH